jgi:hypothetical protein
VRYVGSLSIELSKPQTFFRIATSSDQLNVCQPVDSDSTMRHIAYQKYHHLKGNSWTIV